MFHSVLRIFRIMSLVVLKCVSFSGLITSDGEEGANFFCNRLLLIM